MIDYEDIDCIDHHGIVTAVDAAAGTVTVIINEEDECDCCPAAKLCTIKDKTADRITVASDRAGDFKKGEEVTLRASERMHRKAILLATVVVLCGTLWLIFAPGFLAPLLRWTVTAASDALDALTRLVAAIPHDTLEIAPNTATTAAIYLAFLAATLALWASEPDAGKRRKRPLSL